MSKKCSMKFYRITLPNNNGEALSNSSLGKVLQSLSKPFYSLHNLNLCASRMSAVTVELQW